MYNVDINMKLYICMKQLFINIIIIMLNIIASKFFINFYLNKC